MADALNPVQALAQILTDYGPLGEEDIADRLEQIGVVDPDTAIDDLLDEFSCPAKQLIDGRWVWLPTLLADRVFTHRLSADEAAHDLLTVTPDLDPITALCDHGEYQRLADGAAVQLALPGFANELLEERGISPEAVDPLGALLLAPGTLAAIGATTGNLVGVRLSGSGLVIERVNAGADSGVGEQLAATVTADAPVYFDAAIWTVCANDPTAFTQPLPPLSQIADDYGLARMDEWLAGAGFDFGRWYFEQGCVGLAERHGLSAEDAFALYSLIQLYEHLALLPIDGDVSPQDLEDLVAADDPETAAGLARLGVVLADPLLAQLLLAETGDRSGAVLGRFAEMLEPRVPPVARVGLRWLRAMAWERSGDIAAAERELLAAEAMNPDWPLVLIDLARIASDRGDAEGGLALLRRAGAEPDHPLVTLLERHRPEPRRDLGRNQPCWCGSGRKYKKCHLGNEQLPLGERVDWLYTKAMDYALLSGWREMLVVLGYERSRYDDHYDDHYDDEEYDPMFTALSDPLVLDVALCEGGAFADFLQKRGSLLPDDERQLAERWLPVQRSVFEVERAQPGQGITVRDIRTGDIHEVPAVTASRTLQPGQLICTRVVPVEDGMRFLGGIEPLAPHQRDPLIELLDSDEAHPVMLVSCLSRRCAPQD